MSMCCVNCFILLSGYFSIKLKLKSVINLWVTLVAIFVPFYLFKCAWTHTFSIVELCFWTEGFSKSGYFIQNYLLLMFFSPALNSFVEKYRDKVTRWTLIFCFIEFWFFCIRHVQTMGFESGYSFIHFVLMYMIGRTVHLNIDKLQSIKRSYWLVGYFACVMIICILYIFNKGRSWEYCNPFVILSSICLMMPFTYNEYHNKTVNYIAKSTLPVYIMQCFNPGYGILVAVDNKLLDNLPYYQYLLASAVVIITFFFCCILYDKVRLKVTTPITNLVYKRLGI